MQIAVIGHGPSVEGKGWGQRIDAHDIVIRLKKGWQLIRKNPQDYGQKLDILITSTETLGCLLVDDEAIRKNIEQYIGYPKNGWFDESAFLAVAEKLNGPFMVPLNLFNYWNYRFRGLSPVHPNMSLGCAAAVFACLNFDTPEVHLFGFDSISDPELDYRRITTIPRTGAGEFPNHDFAAERRLLHQIGDGNRAVIELRNNIHVESERRIQ